MKKLSNFHRKVLNIVVTLMAAIALMLGNVTSVAAYTDINGYPYVKPYMGFNIMSSSFDNYYQLELDDQNAYFCDLGSTKLSNVYRIGFGDSASSFVFPFDPDLYDYYLVGTMCAGLGSSFDLDWAAVDNYKGNSGYIVSQPFGIDTYNFSNGSTIGKSFVGKLNLEDNCNISYVKFFSDEKETVITGTFWFSASIVPVSKSTDYSDALSSILQTLTQINQNIITGNTLQQQTIDAINQNTTNTSNWFTTLITTMQGWYNTQTDNLRTWFYMIEERMSAGFTALYHQMTKEQDEKLNGYDDTTQSDAANDFNTESDKLTELEDQLNDQSHGYVSDYTSTGFNTGVLTTLSSSLIFVTTWFANFWNMGGIFTAGLNFCFSLSIVFFILRLRR